MVTYYLTIIKKIQHDITYSLVIYEVIWYVCIEYIIDKRDPFIFYLLFNQNNLDNHKENRKRAKVIRSLRAERCYYATILINVNMYTRGLSIINNRVELHDINISAQKCVLKNQTLLFASSNHKFYWQEKIKENSYVLFILILFEKSFIIILAWLTGTFLHYWI